MAYTLGLSLFVQSLPDPPLVFSDPCVVSAPKISLCRRCYITCWLLSHRRDSYRYFTLYAQGSTTSVLMAPFQLKMAFVLWLGLISGVFVASSPVVNTPPSLALSTSNQTSHLRLNGSPLDIVNIGGLRSSVHLNSSRLGDDAYRCSSQSYGRPLAEGLQEAYESIPDSSELLPFRDRTAAQVLGVALPFRRISCEESK